MAKSTAIVGYFHTRNDGEQAYHALLSEGFSREEVSLVVGDTRGHDTPALGPRVETGSESETGRDAVIGGLAGLAAGMVAVVLPGIGALLAIGPLAGAIGGLGIGAAAGSIVGLLRDHGISDEEAEFYAEGVRRGGAIVTVNGVSGKRESEAEHILKRSGAVDVEELAEQWRHEGWTGGRTPTGPLGTETTR